MAKHNKISGQFAARLIEMMESPAYRVLSLSAHRALSRIEVEWAHHGGQDNGQLVRKPYHYECRKPYHYLYLGWVHPFSVKAMGQGRHA